MTRLRRLNASGVKQFSEFLQNIRRGAEFHPSPAILHVDDFSERVEPAIEIERLEFGSKLSAAEYLSQVLSPIHTAALPADVGLWSWLALYYFDQLSPKNADGKRVPREDYHYIPARETLYADRHLLAGPYKLFLQHRKNSRLLLYPKVHQHGKFIYDLGFRHELISNTGLIEAIDLLYWDTKHERPKRGASSDGAGNLRRLIAVVQQLDFNYDLFGMSANEILRLLPEEFDRWKQRPEAPAPQPVRAAATAS